MKKLTALDYYVMFSILVLLIFTAISFILGIKFGYMNESLTTCFFAAFGGETFFCAIIQIFKIRKNNGENKEEDN